MNSYKERKYKKQNSHKERKETQRFFLHVLCVLCGYFSNSALLSSRFFISLQKQSSVFHARERVHRHENECHVREPAFHSRVRGDADPQVNGNVLCG